MPETCSKGYFILFFAMCCMKGKNLFDFVHTYLFLEVTHRDESILKKKDQGGHN